MKGLIFTYVLSYGGAVAALFSPFLALLIYICFAIIKPEFLWFWSVPQGNYSRVVAIGLLVGWACHGFGKGRLGPARGITLAFVGFWLCAVLSAVSVAKDQDTAFAYVEGLAKILLPFLVGITVIETRAQLKQLAWVVMLSQAYLAYEFNLSYFDGGNRLLNGFAEMDDKSVCVGMVAGGALAFFLGLSSERWWSKALAFVSAGLMFHTPLFCFSRGGMLALIATGVAAFFVLPKRPKHMFFLAAAVLVCLRLAGPEVREKFMTSFAPEAQRDWSAQSRVELWGMCVDTMRNHPLMGIGPDQWGPWIKSEYGWPTGQEAHNLWLQVGAEVGVPGLALLILFYLICLIRLWPLTSERADTDADSRALARMVFAGIIGFAAATQFITMETVEVPYYIVLLGAGVLKVGALERAAATEIEPDIASRTLAPW